MQTGPFGLLFSFWWLIPYEMNKLVITTTNTQSKSWCEYGYWNLQSGILSLLASSPHKPYTTEHVEVFYKQPITIFLLEDVMIPTLLKNEQQSHCCCCLMWQSLFSRAISPTQAAASHPTLHPFSRRKSSWSCVMIASSVASPNLAPHHD
jgi:hypothetical protein